eukprot:s13_g46.t1
MVFHSEKPPRGFQSLNTWLGVHPSFLGGKSHLLSSTWFVIPQSLLLKQTSLRTQEGPLGMNGFVPVEEVLSHSFARDPAALYAQAIYQRPGEASPHVDGVSAYTATLQRVDGQPLGLVVSDPKPPMRNLLILQTECAAIARWNFLNPQVRIQVGHAIMAVNGHSDPYEMLQEISNAETLHFFIKDKLTRVQQRHFEDSLASRATSAKRQRDSQLLAAPAYVSPESSAFRIQGPSLDGLQGLQGPLQPR